MNFLWVFLGGGIGASLRFALSNYLGSAREFPWATLLVNLIGCALTGWLAAKFSWPANHPTRIFLVVGLLGGFTTFSAFGLETLQLLQRGQYVAAATYVGISTVGGLGLAYLAYGLGKA